MGYSVVGLLGGCGFWYLGFFKFLLEFNFLLFYLIQA